MLTSLISDFGFVRKPYFNRSFDIPLSASFVNTLRNEAAVVSSAFSTLKVQSYRVAVGYLTACSMNVFCDITRIHCGNLFYLNILHIGVIISGLYRKIILAPNLGMLLPEDRFISHINIAFSNPNGTSIRNLVSA